MIRNKFTFVLKAVSPIHFGGNQPGELLLDGDDEPFASGNSIGGALRSFLKRNGSVSGEDIRYYMGEGEPSPEGFTESRIFISHGSISCKRSELTGGRRNFPIMEGTAVNPASGAARLNHKYNRYYLPIGTELTFTVECDTHNESMEQRFPFEKLVYIWARAIEKGELRFGGQKSNGYGRLSVKELTCSEFNFHNPAALDQYIFKRHLAVPKDCREEALQLSQPESRPVVATLSLSGLFPYAVYQAYPDHSLEGITSKVTGLQRNVQDKYYLPGSSIKGLLRHEMWRFLNRLLHEHEEDETKCDQLADNLLQEWFGGPEKAGVVVVEDVVMQNPQEMKVLRAKSEEIPLPKYNRIDRITGGVIDGALKTHNEVGGEALLRLELHAEANVEAKLFPLIYLLRRIGSGLLPLGGRTVIGLGEFKGAMTCVHIDGHSYDFHNEELSENEEQTLRRFYQQFMEYVEERRLAYDNTKGI